MWWTVHQVNWIPILHPTVVKFSMHLIKSPNTPNLNWSWISWSTTTFWTTLASSVFMSSHSLIASCTSDFNQISKCLEPKKKVTRPILFHLLISLYHACFNNNHNLIRRQGKHFALYLKLRIQLMEAFMYNTNCCIHNPIHKITNVTNTQKEVGAVWNTHNE